IEVLQEFWSAGNPFASVLAIMSDPSWRHVRNWLSALETRIFGAPGYFRPRGAAGLLWERHAGFYDLGPMRERIIKLVDFERLNSGAVRISIATTDLETGDQIVFDTARGSK